MSAIYLSEEDVERLLEMRATIEVVEEAFRQLAEHKAMNVPRVRAKAPVAVLHTLSAAAEYLRLLGVKCYATTRAGMRSHLSIYDSQSSELIAIIEANRLGQMRTGAATAVAVEWMADMAASELGIFGSGYQAETQLEAVTIARPIKQAFVYSRDEEKRESFAERMSKRLKIEVVPVDRPQEAVEDLPIVITATSSAEPLFDGNLLSEGTLVCAVGSNWLTKAEIDANVVRRADNIVCDSVEACRHEAGDFVSALEKGVFDWSRAVDLADVVTGKAVGRSTRESVTLFKSVGLAIEDLAVGGKLIDLARLHKVGTPLPF